MVGFLARQRRTRRHVGNRSVAHPAPPRWLAPAVAATAFFLYAITLRTGIGFGDSGELVAAALTLGVPHPPGYPVWTILSHLWTYLPGDDPAWKIALSSAVYMAVASGGVAWLLWKAIDLDQAKAPTRARSVLAGGGALLFAFSTEAWSAAIATEVYALHILLAVLAWMALLQWGRGGAPRVMTVATGLLLGLGLANHQTLLLAVPGYVAFAFVWDWRRAARPRMLALFVLPATLGVAAYGLLPLLSARDPLVDWGNTETWQHFWEHLSRKQYRSLSLRRDLGMAFAQLRFFGAWLVGEYVWVLVPGLLALLATWRRETHAGRAWVAGQGFMFVGAGLFFTYIANTELDNSNRAVLSVYFMLPGLAALLLAIPAIAWWLESGSPGREKQSGNVAGAVLALAFIQAISVAPEVTRRANVLGEHFVQHIVADLPENAVVVAGTGVVHFGMLYAKATNDRPDIVTMSFNRLANMEYQAEVENQRTGLVWPGEQEYIAAFHQVAPGATEVYGREKLAVANGYVFGKLLLKNPDRTFFYDEGIPVPWVYEWAQPHGMLLQVFPRPVGGVDAKIAARDREFWDAITKKLLRRHDYPIDFQARQAFSRRRSTIGAWYAWHKDWANAEYALDQAITLSVDNVDAYVKLAMVHAAQGDTAKGEAILQAALDRDSENGTLQRLLVSYQQGTARWYGSVARD